MAAFKPITSSVHFPDLEASILKLWDEINAFERSVEQRDESTAYTFYDGPPFATGLPHYGHLVASSLKDIVPRYWTMRGHRVERRFGWDTHGLPIEMDTEKKLGLSGPSSIREYGVDKFNEACRSGVLRYTEQWRETVRRLGRWVDFDNDYKTMDLDFMESVWWVFGQLWDKGLVYEDYRVMPYSWRLATSLSNFEAGLDYRDVQDPALTVKMPTTDGRFTLLIWTTTPWTLPSNLAIAVGEDIDYVQATVEGDDTVYIVAKALLKKVLGKKAKVLGAMKGSELVGLRYAPLFDYFADHDNAFQVITADHVTTESGTGLVHMAPDFGEEDFNACRDMGIRVLDPVDDEGNFRPVIADFAGRNIKEADPDIIKHLKDAGRIFKHETLQHSYPFCWRSGTPLIYRAVPARFIKVTAIRERMAEHNKTIHWVPDQVGHKRFGNWIENARDWNISRNRFWGTPIPVWVCGDCGHEECISSKDQLEERTGAAIDDIHPHFIDHLPITCGTCGGESKRITDVFDCWFESGSMPYAQNHYPFENKASFEGNFPAQFIAEGLDQTRGWFYTLLILSTALFDKPPFENVIVNGMVLAEDGSKMSKSKQNYPPVSEVLDAFGADALRAYLINSPIVRAEPLRFAKDGVKDVVRTVLLPLRNAWSFFVQYANVDGWTPTAGFEGIDTPAPADRPELDRWILSVLQSLIRDVNTQMEGYYLYKVVPPMVGFIDDLTNWYIRRSRRRFWRAADSDEALADKAAAYATLYEVLTTFAQVIAPVLPFLTEAMYQNLVVQPGAAEHDSIHLTDYPEVDEALIDETLETEVALSRTIVKLGRFLREKHKLKTRQPLAKLVVVHHEKVALDAVNDHADILMGELNVKEVAARTDGDELATLQFKPNFATLGRRLGKRMKEAAGVIAGFTSADWTTLQNGGTIEVAGEAIGVDDVLVTRQPKGDVVIATEGPLTVALDTVLTDALVAEGLVREVISRIQRARKEADFEVTDRIEVTLRSEEQSLYSALEAHRDWIAEEVLATKVELEVEPGEESANGLAYGLSVRKA